MYSLPTGGMSLVLSDPRLPRPLPMALLKPRVSNLTFNPFALD